jgi:hypothetical protein
MTPERTAIQNWARIRSSLVEAVSLAFWLIGFPAAIFVVSLIAVLVLLWRKGLD